MNALIRKEARMLLPAWVAALVAATAPLWLGRAFGGVSFYLFVVAIMALALSPFGLETSHGTFGLLLVQPADRRRFWRIKTGLLAIALASAWALFTLCLCTQAWANADGWTVLKWTALLMLLAFSGGLWSTLLLRDIVTSFFCTCLVPAGIGAVTAASLAHWMDLDSPEFRNILFAVLAAYAAVGLVWARRLLLDAQDVPWTGGHISLQSGRGMSLRWLAFEFKDGQNKWTALVKKELQLQEITMFLIPALGLLHLVVVALYHFNPQWRYRDGFLVAVPFIWVMTVPFVIGCVTVAEERRLNTLESYLCLPVSKRVSFAVKFAVAMVLGTVLGGVVPWVLARLSGVPARELGDVQLRMFVGAAAGITALTFYASTMSRGLLQAIPAALCAPTLAGMAVAICERFTIANGAPFARGLIFSTLAWPVMTITLVWLAFRNYQRLQIGWRVWVENFVMAGAAAGCVTLATIAIFDRSWELFLPLEPRHGPARISGAGRAAIGVSASGTYVLLPDGRLWVGKQSWVRKKNEHVLKNFSGGFVPGSDWAQVTANNMGAVAIQSDGTLWKISPKSDIHQIGSDSDWRKIAAGEGFFLALKQDGTLWGWGHNERNILTEQPQGGRNLNIANPVRVGNDSDWVNIFVPDSHAVGVKRDGTTWRWGYIQLKGPGSAWETRSVRRMVRADMEGSNWLSMSGALGLRADGSLWANGYLPPKILGETVPRGFHPGGVRVGTKSDWVAISGKWHQAALESNGTLWTMIYDEYKRPSKYTDWLAAGEDAQSTWALAKDGTLTCWNEFQINWPDGKNGNATFMDGFFLGPTRRPVISINILNVKL